MEIKIARRQDYSKVIGIKKLQHFSPLLWNMDINITRNIQNSWKWQVLPSTNWGESYLLILATFFFHEWWTWWETLVHCCFLQEWRNWDECSVQQYKTTNKGNYCVKSRRDKQDFQWLPHFCSFTFSLYYRKDNQEAIEKGEEIFFLSFFLFSLLKITAGSNMKTIYLVILLTHFKN